MCSKETGYRVVVAGCGGMSNLWIESAQQIPGVEIVGLMDICRENAEEKVTRYELPGARVDTNLAELLRQTGADVVFDCSIPEAHHEIVLTALASGCHVLGEKPLADSMKHARAMVATADQAGRVYAVMQNRRYDPNIRRVAAFLSGQALGEITTVHCDFFTGPHFGGFRDQMRHPLLLDMAIHTFDAARFLSGCDPVSVFCHEWNPAGSWYAHDGSAVAVFEMSNGVVYTYRGSWCAEGLNTTWEADWRVLAQKGTLCWDGGQLVRAERPVSQTEVINPYETLEVPPTDPQGKEGGHAGVIKDFFCCLDEGRVPETDCHDNIKSLAMVFGAIESAETGQKVGIRWD